MLFLKREIVKQQKGHLIPKKLQVFDPRLGVIFRTYWVKPDEPQPTEMPEFSELEHYVQEAKIPEWLNAIKDELDEITKVDRKKIKDALAKAGVTSLDEWKQLVEDAHKDIKDMLGGERVLIPVKEEGEMGNVVPFGLLLGLSVFSVLLKSVKFEVPGVELPYVSMLYVPNKANFYFHGFFLNFPFEAYTTSFKLDPNSKKWIPASSYYKGRADELKERLVRWTTRYIEKDLKRPFKLPAPEALEDDFKDAWDSIKRYRVFVLSDLQELKSKFLAHYQVIEKALMAFLPQTDAKVATLGLYGLANAAFEVAKALEQSGEQEKPILTGENILEFVQAKFEHAVDEAKPVLGLEKFPIPYETILRQAILGAWILENAAEVYEQEGTEEEERPGFLKVLVGNGELAPSVEWWEASSKFRSFASIIPNLAYLVRKGMEALGAKAGELRIKGLTMNALSDQAIKIFHNLLSQAERKEQSTQTQSIHFVLIDATPHGFYALSKDGTCWGLGKENSHHPYLLGMTKGSFTVQFFGPNGRVGRAWGIATTTEENKPVFFLTNFYGKEARPLLIERARKAFSAILGVSPEKIKAERAHSTFLKPLGLKSLERELTERLGELEIPYLNGDDIIITVED